MWYRELIGCLQRIEEAAALYRHGLAVPAASGMLRGVLAEAPEVLQRLNSGEPGIEKARRRIQAKCNEIVRVLDVVRCAPDLPNRTIATELCGELIDLVIELKLHLASRFPQRPHVGRSDSWAGNDNARPNLDHAP
jgi:hypothetical protein